MNYLRIIFLGIGLIFSFYANAQDCHFSQFNASPLNLNPALTGSINGNARIIANYRNQWPQLLHNNSYMSYYWSYDRRQNLKSGDYWGMGISGSGDVSGNSRYGTAQMNFSLAFAKTISKSSSSSHSLIGGMQSGVAQRKIDLNNLSWPSQIDDEGIHLHSHEIFGRVSNPDFLYLDVNGGLLWSSKFGERKSFFAGMSVFHINKPNVSFQQIFEQPMSIRTCIHARVELPLSPKISILPSFMYITQGIHAQLNIGTMFSATNLSKSLVSNAQGGLYYRAGQDLAGQLHSDAIIAKLSLQVKGIQFGFSYDFTISTLRVDTLGAMEFSVGYVFKKTDKGVTPYDLP